MEQLGIPNHASLKPLAVKIGVAQIYPRPTPKNAGGFARGQILFEKIPAFESEWPNFPAAAWRTLRFDTSRLTLYLHTGCRLMSIRRCFLWQPNGESRCSARDALCA